MRELVLIFLVAAIVGTGAGLFAARQAAASPTSVSHCPCTIWDVSTTPALPTDPDPSAVELGVKFRSDSDGFITGIRFYKGPNNTGTHTGNLWSITGALLASATFTGETATGWQQVDFGSQVPITANTTYVASYHTTSGFYSVDTNYFAGSGLVNPPLQALAGGVDGPNGVYAYGSGGFPTSTWASANYWVDVVFIFDVTTDSTDPTVFITQPSAGDTVSGIVQVTASAFDDVGVAGVQFTLDGINLGVEDTLSPFSTFWDTDAGLNGAYNLSAVARDEAGNTGVAAAVGVTVSNPPILAITTPAGGANIVGGTVNVVYTVQGDQAEVDHVHFQLDGGPELADPTADGAHQVLNVGAGPHTLTGELARADHTTILGSDAAPVSFSVTIPDTIAPTSTITSPGNGLNVLVGNLVVITGTASDAGGGLVDGVDVSVDNGATWNGASGLENWSYQWVPAAEGQVTLLSRAVDDSGNLENPPAVGPTVTVGTDTTNPTVAITQPIAGDVVSGIVQVTASASDDVGVTGVQFMLDGFALDVEDTAPPFSASWDTGGAASGPHTLSAVASDAAGNTGVAPDVVVTVAEYVCPCSTWDASTTPSNPGPNGAELGVKVPVGCRWGCHRHPLL